VVVLAAAGRRARAAGRLDVLRRFRVCAKSVEGTKKTSARLKTNASFKVVPPSTPAAETVVAASSDQTAPSRSVGSN